MKVFKYKINGSPYKVVVQKSDAESVELEVNGTPYLVEIEQKKKSSVSKVQRPAYSSQTSETKTAPKPVSRPASSTGKTPINSPLPGVIVDIKVKEGDNVKKGETIIVLEAMKMENNIQSTSDGKIAKISVNKGDSVLEGTELIVIE